MSAGPDVETSSIGDILGPPRSPADASLDELLNASAEAADPAEISLARRIGRTTLKWGLRGSGGVLALGVALGIPAAEGAVNAVEHIPMHFQVADGLSFDYTVHRGTTTHIDALGAGGSLDLPAAHYKVPIIGSVAASIDPDPIRATPETVDILSAMIATSDSPSNTGKQPANGLEAVGQSLKSTTQHHAIDGALGGAGGAAAIEAPVLGLILALRRNKRSTQKTYESLEKARESLDSSGGEPPTLTQQALAEALEHSRTFSVRHPRLMRLAGIALMGALTAVPGKAAYDVYHDSQPVPAVTADSACATPLNPILINQFPSPAKDMVKDATVCGTVIAMGLNNGISEVLSVKNDTETYYKQTVIPNIQKVFETWQQNPANLAYLNDPNVVRIVQKSDLHCSFPYSQWVLPAIVKGYRPNIIANTGDTMVSTGTLPFESACISIEADGIEAANQTSDKNVMEVAIEGNHDSDDKTAPLQRALAVKGKDGKPYHPIIVLDQHNLSATVDGVPFVGDTDPRASVAGHPLASRTQPNVALSEDQQSALLAKASVAVTKAACDHTNSANLRPIILTHDKREAYPAMANGCVSLAINGHYHWPNGPYTYVASNGQVSFEYTQGTSSGIEDESFSLFETVKRIAPTTEWYVNRATGAIAQSTLTINPDGTVIITNIEPLSSTAKIMDRSPVTTFMRQYLSGASAMAEATPSAAPAPLNPSSPQPSILPTTLAPTVSTSVSGKPKQVVAVGKP